MLYKETIKKVTVKNDRPCVICNHIIEESGSAIYTNVLKQGAFINQHGWYHIDCYNAQTNKSVE